jgi:Ca2+-dependent lipid-binding protein
LQLKYIQKASILSIFVKNCTELIKPYDKIQSLNPYVKLYLLSDTYKENKQKTRIKKNTSNPEFNEEINVIKNFYQI